MTIQKYVRKPDRQEICCGNPALDNAYDHLHLKWIGFDDFILRLSKFFCDSTRFDDVQPVITALQVGLCAYDELIKCKDKRSYPHECLRSFIVSCLASTKAMCCSDEEKEDSFPNDSEFTEALYRKIVPENMKLAMRRFNHEGSILAGNVAGCY